MAGRILVLDDEENYAEMLQELLREHSYRVDMATRPERAIDQLEDIPYDLVISDYKMPVMDGADFLKKSRELYPNLPVILVSGLMNTPELVKVANMGVTLVMEKPLDTMTFLEHVAKFSTPMTEAEKEALENETASSGSQVEQPDSSYPEEPRFFYATSNTSKRFLHEFWTACIGQKYVFLQEPKGGDGELAVKDLSVWRGNQDLPVKSFGLKELMGIKPYRVANMLGQDNASTVAMVRIGSAKELTLARLYCEEADWPEESEHILIFILESSVSDAEFKQMAGENYAAVPPLALRPSDLAGYVRRFARLACDRTGKKDCGELSDDAVLAILSYDWPGNYREVQSVITDAVGASEQEPISMDFLCSATGFDSEQPVPPVARLGKLLQSYQSTVLQRELHDGSRGLTDLVRAYQLEGAPTSADDLKSVPLLDPNLALFS